MRCIVLAAAVMWSGVAFGQNQVVVTEINLGQQVSQASSQSQPLPPLQSKLQQQLEEQLRAVLQDLIKQLLSEVARLSLEQATVSGSDEDQLDTTSTTTVIVDETNEEEEHELVEVDAQDVEIEELQEGDEVSFSVRSDGTVRFTEGDDPMFSETWDFVSEVIPTEYRSQFHRVTFQNDPDTRFAAHVYQRISTRDRSDSNASRAEFTLILNLPYMQFDNSREREATKSIIVHELGHLLALVPSELVYFVDDEDECRTYYVTDLRSCARRGSIYYRMSDFWNEEFYDWSEEYRDLRGSARNRELQKFYQDNPGDFVSIYAATHPDEDLAETFMEFVLEDRPQGNKLVDQKILALYEFDSLVVLRDEIRGE